MKALNATPARLRPGGRSAARPLNGRRGKRARILAAGLKLFAKQPFQQVTMDKVAKLARVAKGTLYLYFPSKQSLYLGILAGGLEASAIGLQSAISPDLDSADRLRHAIAASIEFYYGRSDFLRLLATEQPRVGAERSRLLESWRARGIEFFSAMLKEGIASGVFRPIDSRLVAVAIIGTIRSVLLYCGTDRPVAELNRELATLLFDGLLTRPHKLPGRARRR